MTDKQSSTVVVSREREEFESAWRERYSMHANEGLIRSRLEPESYVNTRTKDAWWAWQKSRAILAAPVEQQSTWESLARKLAWYLPGALEANAPHMTAETMHDALEALDQVRKMPVEQQALHVPDECPHMIVFDDADREPLTFAGCGARQAAMKTWEQISRSWNAHLFVRVARNSRDDRYPSADVVPVEQQGEPVADPVETERKSLIAYGRNLGLNEASTLCSRMAYAAYYPPGTRFKAFTPKAQMALGDILIKACNEIASLPDGPYERFKAWSSKTPPGASGTPPQD
jgi:hypothetical protein